MTKMFATIAEKLLYKAELKKYCEVVLEQRIDAAKKAMDDAQESANAEGKSSAGDKYETSRAMNHLEKDMHARQLALHLEAMAMLRNVNVAMIYKSAQPGAFVLCGSLRFFVSTGLGKQVVNGEQIIFISPQSRLGQKVFGKVVGDKIDYSGNPLISEIF